MSFAPFAPCYIFETELASYGLPTPDFQADIMNLVGMASTLIDEYCGRIDGDGNGSLVYTTYMQRLLLQTKNRNLVYLPVKPISPVSAQVVADLTALGTSGQWNAYFTGVQANTTIQANTGQLTGLIAASGRYGYTRQDQSIAYPDLWSFINPLNLVTMFGGPAPWVAMDISNADVNTQSGEIWIPAGLQLQRYSEVWVTYNSGYDPRVMPRAVKYACACIVKNALLKGDGTTALLTMSLSRSGANATMLPTLIDPMVDQMLIPFKCVRAY